MSKTDAMGQEFTYLISILTKLPGMGPRSAKRAVFDMVKKRQTLLEPMLESLKDVRDRACLCHICNHLDTQDPCRLCTNPAREQDRLCIVEETLDVWTMERIGLYYGLYHVLGGTLSAIDNIGPEQLGLDKLIARIHTHKICDVTLALSATVEGQTTAYYIMDLIKDRVAHVFTLAQGIPLGGNLDYLDDGTLALAFKMRRQFEQL